MELIKIAEGAYRALRTGEIGVSTFETATGGALSLGDLPPGTYTLAEQDDGLPVGYVKATWSFTISDTGTVTSVKKGDDTIRANANGSYTLWNLAEVSLTIKKVDENEKWIDLLKGAEFTLYAQSSSGGVGSVIAKKAVDSNKGGTVTFDGLRTNTTYYVRETTLPTYYTYATATQPTYKVAVGEDG